MASQENKTPNPANERRKKIAAGVLMVVFVFVLLWQLGVFTSEAPTAPTVTAQIRPSPSPKGSPTPTHAKAPEIVGDPLRPEFAFNKNTPLDGSGRNIFVYPTPTPPPPPPTPVPTPVPTPLPITLVGIMPAGVVGKTPDNITLAVNGLKFPNDARIFLDGREIKTTFQDASHLTGLVTVDMIRTAGNFGVQVRSASDPQIYSNSLSFNVAEPPAPPYRFVAIIIGKPGATAVLKSQTDDEVFNVKKGELVDKNKTKRWEVKNITPQRIELYDVQLKISHFINFTAEDAK
jgi:hypothetical protein